jgi:hypothetical protein
MLLKQARIELIVMTAMRGLHQSRSERKCKSLRRRRVKRFPLKQQLIIEYVDPLVEVMKAAVNGRGKSDRELNIMENHLKDKIALQQKQSDNKLAAELARIKYLEEEREKRAFKLEMKKLEMELRLSKKQ